MPSYLEMTYVILITGFVEFKYLYFKIFNFIFLDPYI